MASSHSVREVSLIKWDGSSSHSNIPGIFSLTDETTTDGGRKVMLVITEGTLLFQTTVTAEAIKNDTNVPEGLDAVDYLCSLLTPAEESPSAPRLKLELLENGTLRLQVLKRLASGISQTPWKTIISKEKGTTLLPFIRDLVRDQHRLESKIEEMQTELDSLQQTSNEWKDTAEKLDGCWHREKTDLLQNFLILYRRKQDHATQLNEQVAELQKELEEKNTQIKAATKGQGGGNSLHGALPDFLNDLPDDQDEVLYDSDTVARLATAKGEKSAKKRPRAAGVQPDKVASKTSMLPKKGRNKTTGAIEYYDADALLEDETLFPRDKESDEKEKTVVRSQKTTRAPPKKKKKADPPSDSDTDSTADYIDKGMQSDILSQLAALKDAEG